MNKTRHKYILAFNYAYKTLLVLSGTSSAVCFYSFTTVIGAPIGVASASINLVFLVSNGIVEIFLETMGRKKANAK